MVAESEGALVAKTALLAEPGFPVAMLVMASPLEDPGPVSYPTSGDKGWGVASDEGMRLLSEAFQGISPVDLSPNSPFLHFSSCPRRRSWRKPSRARSPASASSPCCRSPTRRLCRRPRSSRSRQWCCLPSMAGSSTTRPGRRCCRGSCQNCPVSEDQLLQLADEAISYAASAWQVPSLARALPRRRAPQTLCRAAQVASMLRLALGAG